MLVEIPVERMTEWSSTFAIIVCIFCISVDAPAWGGPYLVWAWKGVVAAAAYYKGLHTDKPPRIA